MSSGQTNKPLVSICIPCYNRADLIKETIDSALAQTYTNIEVIINDNQSTDGSWALLQDISGKDERVSVYQNETNLGAVRNWERVMSKATGEYSLILWSDDMIKPGFIEKTLAAFDSETAFVLAGISEFSAEGVYYTNTFGALKEISSDEYFRIALFKNEKQFPVSPACALFRTEELRSALLNTIPNTDHIDFNRNGAGPDLLTFLINAARHPKIKIINEALALFRSHPNSITIQAQQQQGLKLQYDWARYYFIRHYRPGLLARYKAITTLRYYRYGKQHKRILDEMKGIRADYFFLAKLLLSR